MPTSIEISDVERETDGRSSPGTWITMPAGVESVTSNASSLPYQSARIANGELPSSGRKIENPVVGVAGRAFIARAVLEHQEFVAGIFVLVLIAALRHQQGAGRADEAELVSAHGAGPEVKVLW